MKMNSVAIAQKKKKFPTGNYFSFKKNFPRPPIFPQHKIISNLSDKFCLKYFSSEISALRPASKKKTKKKRCGPSKS